MIFQDANTDFDIRHKLSSPPSHKEIRRAPTILIILNNNDKVTYARTAVDRIYSQNKIL